MPRVRKPPKGDIWANLAEAHLALRYLEAYWEPATAPEPRPGLRDAGPGLSLEVASELRALVARASALHSQSRLAARLRVDRAPLERGVVLLRKLRRVLAYVLTPEATGDAVPARQLAALRRAHAERARSPVLVAKQLYAFATLAQLHRARLEAVKAFDCGSIDIALELADELRLVRRSARQPELIAIRAERDRLMAEIWARVLVIRAAARFVFQDHPVLARLPSSARGRKQRATSRRRAKAAEAPAQAEVAKNTKAKAPRARTRKRRAQKKPPRDDA